MLLMKQQTISPVCYEECWGSVKSQRGQWTLRQQLEVIALFWIKWPSATDRITGRLHKESCTWPRCEPALPVCLHQRLRINLLPQPDTPASLTVIPNTHAYTHTHTEEYSKEQGRRLDVCVYSWSDGGIPWPERQIWNGAWSSILVYQLQCYGQSVCLPVCLSVWLSAHRRDDGACVCVCMGGGLLLLMSAKNKHAPHI